MTENLYHYFNLLYFFMKICKPIKNIFKKINVTDKCKWIL